MNVYFYAWIIEYFCILRNQENVITGLKKLRKKYCCIVFYNTFECSTVFENVS